MFDLHENRFLAAGALHHIKDSIESLINITSRGKPLSSSTVVMSRQGRSPDLGYVDFRMTKH
jgi:hypothetical protein